MRYLVLTGNHPRHLYYLNGISDRCNVVGCVLEKQDSIIPTPPKGLDKIDHENFVKHFENRQKYEIEYFGSESVSANYPTHYLENNTNSIRNTVEFIKDIAPDVIFVFGVLNFIKSIKTSLGYNPLVINLNTGLIQRYNGDATLFYPFYFLEPNWAGATFHLINDNLYHEIIHQFVPELERGDTIHEVACKVVEQSVKEVGIIISYIEGKKKLNVIRKKINGKLFLGEEFTPQHLRVIYNLFNDDLVDHFLDKKISSKNPVLIKIKGN